MGVSAKHKRSLLRLVDGLVPIQDGFPFPLAQLKLCAHFLDKRFCSFSSALRASISLC